MRGNDNVLPAHASERSGLRADGMLDAVPGVAAAVIVLRRLQRIQKDIDGLIAHRVDTDLLIRPVKEPDHGPDIFRRVKRQCAGVHVPEGRHARTVNGELQPAPQIGKKRRLLFAQFKEIAHG